MTRKFLIAAPRISGKCASLMHTLWPSPETIDGGPDGTGLAARRWYTERDKARDEETIARELARLIGVRS